MWLTQSGPTNFHGFWKRRILAPNESVGDYMEVNEAEKAALEKSDAEWIEPSEELIAEWDNAWHIGERRYGQYNRATGFFEGNGENAITAGQAREILEIGRININTEAYKPTIYTTGTLPTLLPLIGCTRCNLQDALMCARVKTVRIIDYYINLGLQDLETGKIKITNTQCFGLYSKIEEVKGVLDLSEDRSHSCHFYNALYYSGLKTLWLCYISKPVDFKAHPDFRLECVSYMVENAANTAPITITLHPRVYERLSDDLIASAAAKQITFLTTE